MRAKYSASVPIYSYPHYRRKIDFFAKPTRLSPRLGSSDACHPPAMIVLHVNYALVLAAAHLVGALIYLIAQSDALQYSDNALAFFLGRIAVALPER